MKDISFREASEASLADQEAEIENAQKGLDLRKQFVAGNFSAQEVEIEDRITVAEGNLRHAQSTEEVKGEQSEPT